MCLASGYVRMFIPPYKLDLQYFNQRPIIRLPTSKRVTLNGLLIPLVHAIVTVILYEQVRVQISWLNLIYLSFFSKKYHSEDYNIYI